MNFNCVAFIIIRKFWFFFVLYYTFYLLLQFWRQELILRYLAQAHNYKYKDSHGSIPVIAEEWRHLNSCSLAYYISFLQLYNRFPPKQPLKATNCGHRFSVGQECECDLTSAVKVLAAAMVSSEGSTERGRLLSSLISRVQLFTGNWIFKKLRITDI